MIHEDDETRFIPIILKLIVALHDQVQLLFKVRHLTSTVAMLLTDDNIIRSSVILAKKLYKINKTLEHL